jgi:hypothetical protein
MRDAEFDASFRVCPAKGGTGGTLVVRWLDWGSDENAAQPMDLERRQFTETQ